MGLNTNVYLAETLVWLRKHCLVIVTWSSSNLFPRHCARLVALKAVNLIVARIRIYYVLMQIQSRLTILRQMKSEKEMKR